MLIKLCKRRGQNTAEYAILIGVIVAAAIAMQVYVRRGMQARVKGATDYSMSAANESADATLIPTDTFRTSQYEPYYQNAAFDTNQSASTSEGMATGGSLARGSVEGTEREGNQYFTNYEAANVPEE